MINPYQYYYVFLNEEIDLLDHVANSVGTARFYSRNFYTPNQVFLTLF